MTEAFHESRGWGTRAFPKWQLDRLIREQADDSVEDAARPGRASRLQFLRTGAALAGDGIFLETMTGGAVLQSPEVGPPPHGTSVVGSTGRRARWVMEEK